MYKLPDTVGVKLIGQIEKNGKIITENDRRIIVATQRSRHKIQDPGCRLKATEVQKFVDDQIKQGITDFEFIGNTVEVSTVQEFHLNEYIQYTENKLANIPNIKNGKLNSEEIDNFKKEILRDRDWVTKTLKMEINNET